MNEPATPFEQILVDLRDSNRYTRCKAARALGESRDPRAFEPLLGALTDPAGDVRAKAAAALGRLRDPRAVGPLITALRDDKVSVRTAATAAVKKFGKRAYPPLLDAYKGAAATGGDRTAFLDALAHHKTPAVSELLIAALDDPDRNLHLHVLHLLGRRKDPRAVERLLAELDDARLRLEQVLQTWNGTGIDTGCVGASVCRHPQAGLDGWTETWPRLQRAIWALGEIRDPRAFEPLRDLLESSQTQFHFQMGLVPDIVSALRKIDNPRAVDCLHGLLDDSSFPGQVRLETALAGMDLMNAAQSLRSAAKAGNVGVLFQAIQAAGAAQKELFSQREAVADPEALNRNSTDLMRRLESALRELARGRQDP